MDKLVFPRSCELEGRIETIANPGDIIIECPITPRSIASQEGDIKLVLGEISYLFESLHAPRGHLHVEAHRVEGQSLDAARAMVQAKEVEIGQVTLTDEGLIDAGTATISTIAAGGLHLRAQSFRGSSITSGGNLVIEVGRCRIQEVRARTVTIRGEFHCDRLEATDWVRVESGRVSVKFLDSPTFEAAPDVRGIVMVATTSDVKAEGVRGFLMPSELEMFGENGPNQIFSGANPMNTADLTNLVALKEEAKAVNGPEPEDEQGGAGALSPLAMADRLSVEEEPSHPKPDPAPEFDGEVGMGTSTTSAPSVTIDDLVTLDPDQVAVQPGNLVDDDDANIEIHDLSADYSDDHGESNGPQDLAVHSIADIVGSEDPENPENPENPEDDDSDLEVPVEINDDEALGELMVAQEPDSDSPSPWDLTTRETDSDKDTVVESDSGELDGIADLVEEEDSEIDYQTFVTEEPAATELVVDHLDDPDPLDDHIVELPSLESDFEADGPLVEAGDWPPVPPEAGNAAEIDVDTDPDFTTLSVTRRHGESDGLPSVSDFDDYHTHEDIEVSVDTEDLEAIERVDQRYSNPSLDMKSGGEEEDAVEELGEQDLYSVDDTGSPGNLSSFPAPRAAVADPFEVRLRQVLDEIRSFFSDENFPKFISQIEHYVGEGRFPILMKDRNKQAVLSSFDKLNSPEISELARTFYAVLDDHFAN